MKKGLAIFVFFIVLAALVFVFFRYYSFVMSEDVSGVVTGIEKVNSENLIISGAGSEKDSAALFSFAVAIKNMEGAIYTASSEDRQWAVVKEGDCVDARFYPYPFWDLEKSGTYFNARLLKIRECL